MCDLKLQRAYHALSQLLLSPPQGLMKTVLYITVSPADTYLASRSPGLLLYAPRLCPEALGIQAFPKPFPHLKSNHSSSSYRETITHPGFNSELLTCQVPGHAFHSSQSPKAIQIAPGSQTTHGVPQRPHTPDTPYAKVPRARD